MPHHRQAEALIVRIAKQRSGSVARRAERQAVGLIDAIAKADAATERPLVVGLIGAH